MNQDGVPPSTSTELSAHTIARRVIAYLLRGLQIRIYDWISMHTDNKNKSDAMKTEVREIMKAVREQAYSMVNDTVVADNGRVELKDVLGALEWVIPEKSKSSVTDGPDGPVGIFWHKFIKMAEVSMDHRATVFIVQRIEEYLHNKLYYDLNKRYPEIWADTIKHLQQHGEESDD